MTTQKKTAASSLKTVMGPLWNIYSKKHVYEIIIDAFDDVYYVDHGDILSGKFFKKESELNSFIDRLLKYSKKKISKDDYTYFFQLDSHTRINIVLPPLAAKGPSVVITKNPQQNVTFDDLMEWKALDLEGKNLIESILGSNKGFLVAGNMGSGKTTLFNTLINAIPQPLRVVTLERNPDLVIDRQKTCRLQSQTQKPAEMIELISLAERMRGDVVALSECVGPEVGPFLEMCRSNTTGVALTTGVNVFDAVKRMQTKTVLSSDGFSLEEANYALAQTFSYIIFQEKRESGMRVISSISETSYADGELKLKTIYKR